MTEKVSLIHLEGTANSQIGSNWMIKAVLSCDLNWSTWISYMKWINHSNSLIKVDQFSFWTQVILNFRRTQSLIVWRHYTLEERKTLIKIRIIMNVFYWKHFGHQYLNIRMKNFLKHLGVSTTPRINIKTVRFIHEQLFRSCLDERGGHPDVDCPWWTGGYHHQPNQGL